MRVWICSLKYKWNTCQPSCWKSTLTSKWLLFFENSWFSQMMRLSFHVPLISTCVFCCSLPFMCIFVSPKKPQAAVLKPFKLHEAAWTHLLADVSFSFTGNLSHMSVPPSTISPDCYLLPAMFSYSWVHIFGAQNMNLIEWRPEKHQVSELFFSYLRNVLPTSRRVHLAKQCENSTPLSDLITQMNTLQTLLIPPLHQSISYMPCETLKGSILNIKIDYHIVCVFQDTKFSELFNKRHKLKDHWLRLSQWLFISGAASLPPVLHLSPAELLKSDEFRHYF